MPRDNNVRARCAFLSCSYAVLLHLLERFNEKINDDDDDDDDDDELMLMMMNIVVICRH